LSFAGAPGEGLQQHWCELRAIEIAVQEVAAEFGGEDPLQPDTREMIDDCLRSCTKIRDDLKPYVEITLAAAHREGGGRLMASTETRRASRVVRRRHALVR
jgi:hypothetical protein